MKKLLLLLILGALSLAIAFTLTSCDFILITPPDDDPTEDDGEPTSDKEKYPNLIFTLNEESSETPTYTVKLDTASKEEKIEIPATVDGVSVTDIAAYAFYRNEYVREVTIPDTVINIGEQAFFNCTSLEKITLGNAVTTMGVCAFQNCTSLSKIELPASVMFIGELSFQYCTELYEITVSPQNNEYKSIDGNLYNKNGETLIAYAIGKEESTFTVPDSVKTIGDSAFYFSQNLVTVELPTRLREIRDNAFYECAQLKSCKIPNLVSAIGNNAFYKCTALESITLGSSVESIGDSAFFSCYSLTSLTVPKSLTTIGNWAFSECFKLVEIINFSSFNFKKGSKTEGSIAANAIEIHTESSKLYVTDGFVFYPGRNTAHLVDCLKTDSKIVLPDTMNGKPYYINQYAFHNNRNITSITLGAGVVSIKGHAFDGCYKLAEVVNNSVFLVDDPEDANDNNKRIDIGKENHGMIGLYALEIRTGSSAMQLIDDFLFYTFDGKTYLMSYEGKDTVITLPTLEGVESYSIYKYAFDGRADLLSITVPDCVNAIGEYAFNNCTSVSTIALTNSTSDLGVGAFYSCKSLTGINLPSTITKINDALFQNCISLASVTIPASVTKICDSAFANCDSLINVVIPDGVTVIADSAFRYCDNLKTVKIGAGVETIESWAFSNCDSLESIIVSKSVKSFGNLVFFKCFEFKNLYYMGTREEWESVTLGKNVFDKTPAFTYNYTEANG